MMPFCWLLEWKWCCLRQSNQEKEAILSIPHQELQKKGQLLFSQFHCFTNSNTKNIRSPKLTLASFVLLAFSGKRECGWKTRPCQMASQTRAAGRGHKLFTIPSKDGNLIKWPKSVNSLTLVTLTLWLYCDSPVRRRKTMRLSRALSDLVAYTKSVRVHDIETQGERSLRTKSPFCLVSSWSLWDSAAANETLLTCICPAVVALTSSWQVSSLNETVMNQILQLKPLELVRLNQRQLLRVYPSNYRVDSSNFNPQPYWNAGCHMGECLFNHHTGKTDIERFSCGTCSSMNIPPF